MVPVGYCSPDSVLGRAVVVGPYSACLVWAPSSWETEKTGMGGRGQRKWEEVGWSCNVGMWGCCLRRREDVGTSFKMELGGNYWKC